MDDSSSVFVGLWRDWDRGTWSSWTVTIPATEALYLVSFITLFIRWSGTNLWSILVFAMHQWRSTTEPRDALYHQQQVILRNNGSAFNTMWMFGRLMWRWRGKANRNLIRGLELALPSAVSVAAIAAAAFLSSQFLNPTDFVLTKTNLTCGWLADAEFFVDVVHTDQIENQKSDALYVSAVATAGKSLEYTAACYESQSNEYSSLCSSYVVRSLPSTVNKSAPCPLGESRQICSGPAVRIDSGIIRASTHLGINVPPDHDIGIRKVTTCAPVPLDRYASDWMPWQDPDDDSANILSRYSWKYYHVYSDDSGEPVAFSNDSAWWIPTGYRLLGELNVFEGANNLSVDPLKPELSARNGDLLLLMLQNMVLYSDPVTDLWFKASSQNDTRGYYYNTSWESSGAWIPDSVVSGLGCTEEYQFCANDQCTPLAGLYSTDPGPLGLTTQQEAVYKVVWKSAWAATLYFIAFFLRDGVLLSRRQVHPSLISAPVAADQWVQEAENMHNLSMAIIQRRVVEYSRPPNFNIRPGVGTQQFIVPPPTEAERDICHNVKTRNPAYRSFNLVPLLAILVGGILIMAVNLALPRIVFGLRRIRQGGNVAKTKAWINTHVLHLHRSLLETRGITPWEPTEDDIPVFSTGGRRFVLVQDGLGNGGRIDGYAPVAQEDKLKPAAS
ncbi:hypothetical protein QBC47DRAFT_333883 [Echria macrotheca]|uniref:Uncharacterized protein n=1 Tax=Echria macrotheca TaxID=438768 RepID=A0AAJ0FFM3_9PEZI|nr:hypothetical protein QBC47DRAFT_333883 [Echria macrotheca]